MPAEKTCGTHSRPHCASNLKPCTTCTCTHQLHDSTTHIVRYSHHSQVMRHAPALTSNAAAATSSRRSAKLSTSAAAAPSTLPALLLNASNSLLRVRAATSITTGSGHDADADSAPSAEAARGPARVRAAAMLCAVKGDRKGGLLARASSCGWPACAYQVLRGRSTAASMRARSSSLWGGGIKCN